MSKFVNYNQQKQQPQQPPQPTRPPVVQDTGPATTVSVVERPLTATEHHYVVAGLFALVAVKSDLLGKLQAGVPQNTAAIRALCREREELYELIRKVMLPVGEVVDGVSRFNSLNATMPLVLRETKGED